MNNSNIKISTVNVEERKQLDIRSGDTIKVTQKIKERDKKTNKFKTRLQVFEGLCLSVKHGREAGATFTVRKTASGVGVERIFPIYSPMIDKIEVVKRSKVRRSKLYHIREKAAKEIRRQMRNVRDVPDQVVVIEEVETEAKVGLGVEAEAEVETKIDTTESENVEKKPENTEEKNTEETAKV